MTLYFAWVDPHEPYDPHTHRRHDESILDLEIAQKEGGFARARLSVLNPHTGLLSTARKQQCHISYENAEGIHLLFSGRIIGMPTKIRDALVEFQFTAEPADCQQKLNALCEHLKEPPFWDPLFVAPHCHNDPLETLEARAALFYWSRTQGTVELSDIFQGPHFLTLGDQFYYDSLRVEVGPPPLEAVQVRLIAEWTQRYAGEVDLAPLIAAHFPEGMMNTLTGADLRAKWWQTGEYIAFPGYRLIESALTEIIPPRTGLLNLYPRHSPLLWAGPDKANEENDNAADNGERQRIRFKRTWFRGCLRLGWHYHQRRKETATFTLRNKAQKITARNGRQRTLTLFLQDIVGENHFWRPHFSYQRFARVIHEGAIYRCRHTHISGEAFDLHLWEALSHCQHISDQASRPTFFFTERGKQAIAHALEIARAHLAMSTRMIMLTCAAPFDSLFKITTNHTLFLSDPCLPGGKAQGKVIAYRLCMEGQTGRRYVEATLGVAIGAEASSEEPDAAHEQNAERYAQDTWCEASVLADAAFFEGQTPSGIRYRLDNNQYPKLGLLHPSSMTMREIVQEIQISHTATQQIQHLQNNQYPKRHNLQSVLQEIPTQITLRLRDLSPVEVLSHTLTVDVPDAWSAPRQINLAAPPVGEE